MESQRGVYFRREDYASFPIRLLVDVLDLLIFALSCCVLAFLVAVAVPEPRLAFNFILSGFGAIAVLYFVVLKRSRFRTVGYRIGKVRIVGVDGDRPGYWPLIVRMMFGALGPFNWLVDVTWLSQDANRQALRDKFANTYVVRLKAEVAGDGPITFRLLFDLWPSRSFFVKLKPPQPQLDFTGLTMRPEFSVSIERAPENCRFPSGRRSPMGCRSGVRAYAARSA